MYLTLDLQYLSIYLSLSLFVHTPTNTHVLARMYSRDTHFFCFVSGCFSLSPCFFSSLFFLSAVRYSQSQELHLIHHAVNIPTAISTLILLLSLTFFFLPLLPSGSSPLAQQFSYLLSQSLMVFIYLLCHMLAVICLY